MSRPEEQGWQPIETAPLSTRVFLWCPDETAGGADDRQVKGTVFGTVRKFSNGTLRCYAEGMGGDWSFTFWRPLFKPPVQP